MRIVKNEKLIKRNSRIGQYTSFAALAVLGVGMYISMKRPDLFFYAVLALILGFTMTQIGMFFSNRWGRSPRPDEQLDAALKGLPGDTVLYHYVTPASHLLVGPAGVWILQTHHQKGKVTYDRNRWRVSGGGRRVAAPMAAAVARQVDRRALPGNDRARVRARGARPRADAPVGGGSSACVGRACGEDWRSLETSWWWAIEGRQAPQLFAETRGFSSLTVSSSLGLRLVEG